MKGQEIWGKVTSVASFEACCSLLGDHWTGAFWNSRQHTSSRLQRKDTQEDPWVQPQSILFLGNHCFNRIRSSKNQRFNGASGSWVEFLLLFFRNPWDPYENPHPGSLVHVTYWLTAKGPFLHRAAGSDHWSCEMDLAAQPARCAPPP